MNGEAVVWAWACCMSYYCCIFDEPWLLWDLKLVTDIFNCVKKLVYAVNLHCIHLEWLHFPPRAAKFESALLKRRDSLLQLFTLLVLIAADWSLGWRLLRNWCLEEISMVFRAWFALVLRFYVALIVLLLVRDCAYYNSLVGIVIMVWCKHMFGLSEDKLFYFQLY